MILYLHGFNSSPASFKARLFADHMAALGRGDEFRCPKLPPRPAEAARIAREAAAGAAPENLTLVGSSMGGYYATHLAEALGCKAVLVNPAVRPYELLAGRLGPQENYYDGESYVLTQGHLDELRALEVDAITRPERYLLLTQTGDEVLDYRDAVARYAGCRQVVIEGGDHAFRGFADYLPMILAL